MPLSDEDRAVLDDFRHAFMEGLFRSSIEDGSIEVGDRNFREINADFMELLTDLTAELDFDPALALRPVFSYEERLLERAAAEVALGESLIGVMFYVIWLEHFVNGMLIRSFARTDHHSDVYMPMIRSLNLSTKLTSTWALAGLPSVATDQLRLINQAIEVRNAFVHYKWPAFTHQDADRHIAKIGLIAGRMEQLATYLTSFPNLAFWNGREQEITEAFRADLAAREAANPPPYSNGL